MTLSELVLDGVSGSTHSGSLGTSSLDHEVLDDPVEDDSVVESVLCEFHEVASGDGHVVVHLDLDVSHGGVEDDGASGAFDVAVVGDDRLLEGSLVEHIHALDDDVGHGLVVATGLDGSDLVDDVHSVDDLSEDGVCGRGAGVVVVEELVVNEVDEELGSTGVGSGIRHGDCSPDVGMSLAELIIDLISGSTGTVALGASSLDHEVLDDPVEGESVVESIFGEFDEVSCGDGHVIVHE